MVQLLWDSIYTYNHLNLEKLEILRKMMYGLTFDKIELNSLLLLRRR
jgi:hypothetical protein